MKEHFFPNMYINNITEKLKFTCPQNNQIHILKKSKSCLNLLMNLIIFPRYI